MNAIMSIANILFPIITFPYLAEVIKPEGTGKIGAATSIMALFLIIAQLGIPTYGIRACAAVRDDKEQLTRTAQELLIINIFMAGLSYVFFIITLFTVPVIRDERLLYTVMSATLLLDAIGMEWLYKALEEYRYITVRSVIFKTIALIAMFLLVHKKEDYVIYGAISVFATSGSMILNFIHARKFIDLKPCGKYDFSKHLKMVGIFLAMSCATTIYTNLDTVMLKVMTSDTDTGYYYASVKVKNAVLAVITSLGAVLLPRVSYYVEKNMIEEFKNVITKALKFVTVVSLGAVFFFILTARPCIMFISGAEFEQSIIPMRIIIPTVFLIGISNILGIQVLVPQKKEKVLLFIEIGGALIDFVINLLLIGRLRSAGAAIGTLLAECFVTGALIIYLARDLKGIFRKIEILRIIPPLVLAACFCIFVYYGIDRLLLIEAIPDILQGFTRPACIVRIGVSFLAFCLMYVPLLWVFKEGLTREIVGRAVDRIVKKRS